MQHFSLSLFFALRRCLNGSDTIKSCSCRHTQTLEWATSMQQIYRPSMTTLPWTQWYDGEIVQESRLDTLSLDKMRQPLCLLVTHLMVSSSGILSLFSECICEYLTNCLGGDAALWGRSLRRRSDTADLGSVGSGLEELCLGTGGAQCHLGHVLGVPPKNRTGKTGLFGCLLFLRTRLSKSDFWF